MNLRWMLVLICTLGLFSGCDHLGGGPSDASAEYPFGTPAPDGPQVGEGGTAGTAVDFVAQGCESRTAERCEGQAPMTLTFSALVEKHPLSISWTWGDGTESSDGLVVRHTYVSPGHYDVRLTVGETSGTSSRKKQEFVVVTPAEGGAACSTDAMCASGSCACFGECTFPLDHGLCLNPCGQWPLCPEGMTCIDLNPGTSVTGEAWQTRLCLPSCQSDTDCHRQTFVCQWAPSSSGWQKACLPPQSRFIGQPCRNDEGELDSSRCLGGRCLDLGSGGYCSASCTPGTCPSGSRCLSFFGAPDDAVCLARCPDSSCGSDPLLACEGAGGQGYFSIVVGGGPEPAESKFCSAKSCGLDVECGLTGRCDLSIGGFCTPK